MAKYIEIEEASNVAWLKFLREYEADIAGTKEISPGVKGLLKVVFERGFVLGGLFCQEHLLRVMEESK